MLPLTDPFQGISTINNPTEFDCTVENKLHVNMSAPDIEPITSPPSHWSIFTEEPSYPMYPMDKVKICPIKRMDEKTDVPLEQPTTKEPPVEVNENPMFQPFNSIEAKLTASTTYNESVDISSTYIGAVKEDNKGSFQTELQFPFDAQSFTSGSLPNGKEFKILIDTGATHSYLSKSFYDTNPYLHKFPKIKPKASCIFVGNGEWVPALFIIPMCFSIENHAFEVYTIVCPMANSDFIWGMKNVVETEGQLCTRTMKYKFLNRSPKIYPLKSFSLPPDGSEHPVKLRVDFPSEIGGHTIAKFMLLPNHLLKTVKVPVRRNKITMHMSNHSQDKIEATPDTPIGILDVHSLGFFHIGLEHLKKTHLREYRFKTLHEVEYQMIHVIDFVNDQNNPSRNQI